MIPNIISQSAIAMIFLNLYNAQYGAVNSFLKMIGLESLQHNWLFETATAFPAVTLTWFLFAGYTTTLVLAQLLSTDESLIEAAEIDGANTVQKFTNITIPYLKPITTYVLLTGIIGTLQMFDQAYIFSNGSGGPANSTLTVSLMVYRYAFGTNNAMGYAACIAIILALVIMAVSMIAEKLNNAERWY